MRNAGGGADARTSQALVRPRSSGNWSFRESASSVASQLPVPAPERRHRNSKAEIRRVRKLGGTILVVHAEGPPAARAGIRSVGVSGSRIVLEKDGSVLEFPKQPTHTSGSSPRKHPLLRKPENGKLPDIVPACVPARTEILNRPAKKQSRRTTVGSQRTKMAEQKSAWAAGRSVAANGYPVPQRSREGVTARNLDRLQAGARTRVR